MSNSSDSVLDTIRGAVRRVMRRLAAGLNRVSGGKLSPTMVTITGVLAHIPIALLIASRHFWWAAVLLVIFGLFDTLDGELARLQHSTSASGMLLDSVTDRLKEIMLYGGVAWQFVSLNNPYMTVWAVLAVGASLWVSYINAWGEAVAARHGYDKHAANKAFRGGILPFEIRMAVLILGLLTHLLAITVGFVAIMAAVTALTRLVRINRYLNTPQIVPDDQD